MRYRAWACAGTALALTLIGPLSAHAQTAPPQPATLRAPATFNGVPLLDPAAQTALQSAINGRQRIEPSRDRWRNPAATLQFFGVRPTDTVIEIWPGQGWYTSILGPYLKQGGGRLVVGHFDAASSSSSVVRQMVDAYRGRFANNPTIYGEVSVGPFGPLSGPLVPPGTADSVLTFRNIHNWMAQNWAEKAFADFFLVLKPGGILGIEEHRGRTDEPQDPLARDGYVREDFVIQLAREAGFEFIGRSEINANPADTKDHPFGVWTLPPVARTSPLGKRDDPGFDRTRYSAIGESDRMTLRFRKPLTANVGTTASRTRLTPVIVNPAATPPVAVPLPRRAPPLPVRTPAVAATPPSTPVPVSVVPSTPVQATAKPSTTTSQSASPPVVQSAPVRAAAVPQPPASEAQPPVPSIAVPRSPPPPAAAVSGPPIATNPPATIPPVEAANESPPPPPTPQVVQSPPPPLTPPAGPSPSVVSPRIEEPKPDVGRPEERVPTIVARAPTAAVSPTAPVAADPIVPPIVAAPAPGPAPQLRPARRPAGATPSPIRGSVNPPSQASSPSAAPTPPQTRTSQPRATRRATTPTPSAVRPSARPNASTPPSPPKAKAPARAAPARQDAPATDPRPPAARTKTKTKRSDRPTSRPTQRPPVIAPPPKKKASPPPPPNPNKPDWVVPRQRS